MQKNIKDSEGFSQDNNSCPGIPVELLVPWNSPSMTTGPRSCTGEQSKKSGFLHRRKAVGANTGVSSSPLHFWLLHMT